MPLAHCLQVQAVAECFQDLALLVGEQGAHIDNIQTNLETAAERTAKGVDKLDSASKSQRACALM